MLRNTRVEVWDGYNHRCPPLESAILEWSYTDEGFDFGDSSGCHCDCDCEDDEDQDDEDFDFGPEDGECYEKGTLHLTCRFSSELIRSLHTLNDYDKAPTLPCVFVHTLGQDGKPELTSMFMLLWIGVGDLAGSCGAGVGVAVADAGVQTIVLEAKVCSADKLQPYDSFKCFAKVEGEDDVEVEETGHAFVMGMIHDKP